VPAQPWPASTWVSGPAWSVRRCRFTDAGGAPPLYSPHNRLPKAPSHEIFSFFFTVLSFRAMKPRSVDRADFRLGRLDQAALRDQFPHGFDIRRQRAIVHELG
jgi:hypothetical protein